VGGAVDVSDRVRLSCGGTTGVGYSAAVKYACAALGAVAAAVLGALPAQAAPAPADPSTWTYVALGDSRSAGPTLNRFQAGNPCQRSDWNFPSLLAAELGVARFDDVACVGANGYNVRDTPQVENGQSAPQSEALRGGADLVTIAIGGNDIGLLPAALMACLTAAPGQDRNCRGDGETEAITRQFMEKGRPEIDSTFAQVRAAVPEARIYAVGVGGLFGDRGCWPNVPLSDADVQWASGMFEEVNALLRELAEKHGMTFIDIAAAVAENDRGPCSPAEERWVEGLTPASDIEFNHLNEAGHRAIADLIKADLAENGVQDIVGS
jgi:lysophospholipase L1-like esterase